MAEFEPDHDEQVRLRVIAKAWQDPQFKDELLRDPKSVVARELGVRELPDELDIRVFEEPPNGLYLILPAPPPDVDPRELSVDELAEISQVLPARPKKTRAWYCY